MDFSFSALAASSSTSVSSVLATGSVFSIVCTASTASVTTAVSVSTAACADSTASAGAVSSTTTGISSFASASACCSGAASPTVFCATTASIAVSCTSCVVSVLSTGAAGAILEARCSSFACSAASFAKRRRSRGSLATREADASGGVNGNTGAGSASSVGFWLGSSTSRVTGRFSSAAVSTTRVLAYCSANFCKARLNVVTKPNCSIRNLQSSP